MFCFLAVVFLFCGLGLLCPSTNKKGTENGWQFVTLFIFAPEKKAAPLLRLQSYLGLDIFFGPWVGVLSIC